MRGKVIALSKGSKVINSTTKNAFGSHSRIKEQGQGNFYNTLKPYKREQSCKIASELKIDEHFNSYSCINQVVKECTE